MHDVSQAKLVQAAQLYREIKCFENENTQWYRACIEALDLPSAVVNIFENYSKEELDALVKNNIERMDNACVEYGPKKKSLYKITLGTFV